jgi:hypothetical protein
MANRGVPIGGVNEFQKLWIDCGANLYAEAVVNMAAIAGEEQNNGRVRVEMLPVDGDSLPETLQSAVNASGNGTAINAKGFRSIGFQILGTFVGNVIFEATEDDTQWDPIAMLRLSDNTVVTCTATAGVTVTGLFKPAQDTAAYSQIRARVIWTSGTSVTVKSRKVAR